MNYNPSCTVAGDLPDEVHVVHQLIVVRKSARAWDGKRVITHDIHSIMALKQTIPRTPNEGSPPKSIDTQRVMSQAKPHLPRIQSCYRCHIRKWHDKWSESDTEE